MSYQRNSVTYSIIFNNIKLFKCLIDSNCDVSYQNNLLIAMDNIDQNKDKDFFRTLVKNDHFRKNRLDGLNFIHYAILTKNYYCLKRLIRNGYNVSAKEDLDSALSLCIIRENYDAANIILYELNKLYNVRNNNYGIFLNIINEEICEIEDDVIIDKYSLLIYSINSDKIFFLLLKYGADPFYKDFYGQTILSNACLNCSIEVIKKILSIPGMLKYINAEDIYGNTPLLEVVETSDIELANLLLENGADPEYIPMNDIFSWSVLHEACDFNNFDMIKLLLKYGAKVNLKDLFNKTPIFYSIYRNDNRAVKLLLENGADANNIRDVNKFNARSFAEYINNTEAFKEINWFYRKNFMIAYHYNINCDDNIRRHFMMYNSPFRLLCDDLCRVICSYL